MRKVLLLAVLLISGTVVFAQHAGIGTTLQPDSAKASIANTSGLQPHHLASACPAAGAAHPET